MKILKYISVFCFGTLLLALTSCVEDERQGGDFPDFKNAANMRIIVDPNNSSINADDPGSAKVVMDLFSENLDEISSVDLSIDFFDFSEKTTTSKVFLKSVPLGNFSDGVMRGFEISFVEIRDALGFTDSDFDGLDVVTVYNVTTMADGRVYPSTININQDVSVTTVAPNVANSTATTSFTSTIPVFVQCPLDAGFATGTYAVEQISGPADPFFGNPTRFGPGDFTINEDGPIQRSFTSKYFTFDVTFNFIVTCGTLVVPKTDSGLGCGGPNLGWAQDGVNTYTDDSEFTITLLDNVDGGCGLPVAEPLVLKLTKK